ncbi:fungal specific transcription factor domain protein, partial [Rhizoctonia solani AG-3 Rhs1AP]
MFMQRTQISGFELHIGRVLRSFQPGSSEPAVPALYYAMLLLGCHFISEPELKFWESMFFERTKLEIETNIARAHSNDTSKYNPLHHLQAMVMLGQWFYFKCRLLEGYVYMTRAMHHKLKPPRRGAGRWSPRDPVELGEAINLWWACLMRDFIGTVLNGLPPSISLEEIKTVWPVSLSDFEDWSGSELSNDNHSIASLFDPEHFHIVTDISKDTANSIAAKATILICCAGKLDTERISNSEVTDEWWARFEECDRTIQSFAKSTRKAKSNSVGELYFAGAVEHPGSKAQLLDSP